MSNYCEKCVGVDSSHFRLSEAKVEYESITNLSFFEIDAFNLREIKKLGEFSVIFLDISGNRELSSILPLIERLESLFKSTVCYFL